MQRSTVRRALPYALVALAFFVLGALASWLRSPGAGAPAPGGPSTPRAAEPRIVLDPASIDLLPDASLRLELPAAPDAGSADGPGSR